MYVIPTLHPAYILRTGRQIVDILADDIAKAWEISERGEPDYEANIISVLPSSPYGLQESFTTALNWIKYWHKFKIPTSVDVETSSLDFFNCKLYSIGLSGVDGNNVAVSFSLSDYHTIQWEYEQALIAAMTELLADPEVQLIFHNSPFDRAVLARRGIQTNGKIWDTLGLAHLYQPDMPKGLGWVGHTWLQVRPWKLNHKGDKLAFARTPEELLYYNGEDALNTGLLVAPMVKDLHQHLVSDRLISFQMDMANLATDMELNGLPINFERRRKMGCDLLLKMERTKHKMREYLSWPDFNPMSDKHRRAALFGQKYRQPPWSHVFRATQLTEKLQEPSTSYKALIDVMEHPFVKNLVDYVESRHTYATQYRESHAIEAKKLKDLGLEEELADFRRNPPKHIKGGAYQRAICPDMRLHPQVNPCGQKGSRVSTSPNVQNQREEHREFFEAGDGRILVSADKDQLELRICAVLAGCEPLLQEMRRPGGDPHTLTTTGIFGESFLKKGPDDQKKIRTGVKTTTYAALYLAKVLTVWRTIRERKQLRPEMRAALTLSRVSHIYHSIFGLYPELRRYHQAKIPIVREKGHITCPPFDRPRWFPVWPPPTKELANWDIQTAAGDVVGMQMCELNEELKRRYHGSAKMILHLHDQFCLECDEKDAEDIRKLSDQIFGSFILEGPAGPVDLSAEAKIAKDLYHVK